MITEILITTKAFEKRSKVIVFNEKGQIVGHTYSEEVGEILDYSDKNIVCRKEGKLYVYDESFQMVNYNYECAVGKFKKNCGTTPHLPQDEQASLCLQPEFRQNFRTNVYKHTVEFGTDYLN